MDPYPFVRVIVESLALKLPVAVRRAGPGVHSCSTPCYCKLRLRHFSSRIALVPLCSESGDAPPGSATCAAYFDLEPAILRRLSAKTTALHLSVYTGRMGSTCGVNSGKLLGRVRVILNLEGTATNSRVFQNGWLKLGKESEKPSARLYIVVRAEPDPRYVFQFGGEPECSPVVFQIQENIRQPVFSCKFSADRSSRNRFLQMDATASNISGGCGGSFPNERGRTGKERKGWMIMIYDLSGSPVAAASIITPFVPSPGSDCVSRSNPGAWLILRPDGVGSGSWKPWGRLEAWRERGGIDGLGYKFELVTDSDPNRRISIAEATMSVRKGGHFCIDTCMVGYSASNSWLPIKGFVMGSTVEGEGKVSKPAVHIGARHVTCMADAALFIALSAAIDLSMDACRIFSHKLRKELSHNQHDYSS